MFYNLTRRKLGILFICLFLAVSAIAILGSCAPEKTYFSLTEEGHYDWTPGPSVENAEQYLAYQHQGSFMLAKNSVSGGLKAIKKVIAVGQTEFTNASGKTVACLAYKSGKSYEGPWEVVTFDGETVVSADRGLSLLPSKIITDGDSLKFVR
ncbi:MAG: hypothetical protein KBC12_00905 [Candidatus Pacebacteria bacterium]|nr:hypothetical protein [Candidatus Paceibacterota bacterium]